MPTTDPDRRREAQRTIQRDRSRGVAIYRAALLAAREDNYPLLGSRFWTMVEAELQWRRTHGIPLPPWPTTREKQLLEGATSHEAGQDEG